MIGETFGPYKIIEPLGARGMGEVYRARDTKLDRERLGIPEELFDGPAAGDLEGITGYDVSADGSRFVMVRPAIDSSGEQRPRGISIVLNGAEELKRLAPVGGSQ